MLAAVLSAVEKSVRPGLSTKELANVADRELKALGGKPAFQGYRGFPDVICISLNDEIVHGIPSASRIVMPGDIVSLDFGVSYQGMLTDSALTVIAGSAVRPEYRQLIDATNRALEAGIDVARHNVQVGDISAAVQASLQPYGYGIPRDLVGHGIGQNLWEEPNIPNYGQAGTGLKLSTGMTIAIEPMVTLGTHRISVDEDGWTIRTADGSMAAHFEHTILILEDGVEILTRRS